MRVPRRGPEFMVRSPRMDASSGISTLIDRCRAWVLAPSERVPKDPDEHCPTRDVFTGRLDHARIILERAPDFSGRAPELIAAAGEIGNNAFDHNIGQWRDIPGCWFGWVIEGFLWRAVIADRGQGVLATLRRIRPELSDDASALRVAFHEVISGRSPEQRGNGLKFVVSVIGRGGAGERLLDFSSGVATVTFRSDGGVVNESHAVCDPRIPGTIAMLTARV